MLIEDYVSFETAKLLKEKGFDVETCTYWDLTITTKTPKIGTSLTPKNWNYKWNIFLLPISAPTLQMAMKWLREVHKLGISPSTYTNIIGSNTTHVYGTTIVNLNTYEIVTSDCMARDTYNEACEAAIKYCLENLI